jgi:hypothetical protein
MRDAQATSSSSAGSGGTFDFGDILLPDKRKCIWSSWQHQLFLF